MDLFQILLNIHDYQDDETIYAVEPWTLESEAKVIRELNQGMIPINCDNLTFAYFLEIFLVKEIFENLQFQNVCMRDQCQRIIEYAIHDA